jgi:hypothetical protein
VKTLERTVPHLRGDGGGGGVECDDPGVARSGPPAAARHGGRHQDQPRAGRRELGGDGLHVGRVVGHRHPAVVQPEVEGDDVPLLCGPGSKPGHQLEGSDMHSSN